MRISKKTALFGFVMLCVLLAACQKETIEPLVTTVVEPTTIVTEPIMTTTEPVATENQITSRYTYTTSIPANVTTIRAWNGPFKTEEIKAFFEKHQQTMLELATILTEHDVKSLNISWGIYDGDPIPEELRGAFFTFFSLMEAETNSEAQIAVGTVDSRRVISFCFDMSHAENGSARIRYVPDGYFRAEDVDYSNETQLAKNWYGYWR